MPHESAEQTVTIKGLVDFVLIVVVFLPSIVFFFTDNPFKRGFFCDDESIAHPYKDSTITELVLVLVGIGLPAAAVIGSEIFLYLHYRKTGSLVRKHDVVRNRFRCFKWRVNRVFAEMYINIGMFLFGAAVCQSTTDIMKYSIGRLRPHFLDVCKPNWDAFNCTDSQGFMRYVEDFECSGDEHLVNEARKSHPSGHASLSAYCMVYLCFYIERKMTWKGSKLLKRVLQIAALYMALYCGLSRISDYKHHWSDVLMGFVLGTTVALINALYLSGLFKKTSPLSELSSTHLPILDPAASSGSSTEQSELRESLGQSTAYRRVDGHQQNVNNPKTDNGHHNAAPNGDWI